jgi:predicted Fe-Mo cluster-binding NifX family protein
MKIALSTNHQNSNALLERRFGRCAYFAVVDTEQKKWEFLVNPASQALGGAGTRAAQFLANQDVQVVISGDFGPNAFTALNLGHIQMYQAKDGMLAQLLEDFFSGYLQKVDEATAPKGHRRGGSKDTNG